MNNLTCSYLATDLSDRAVHLRLPDSPVVPKILQHLAADSPQSSDPNLGVTDVTSRDFLNL